MLEQLRAGFGLTTAEARVALALVDDDALVHVADRLCISRNTVRTHLQRIFGKTNTARQTELIRVLVSAAPMGSAT